MSRSLPRVARRRVLLAAASTILLTLAPLPAAAQDWPSKNIRLVVPFPAGGGTDTVARVLAQKLNEALKQTVIVDNVGGASGAIGHEQVARAAPDGHTILLATASTISTNPLISKVTWHPVNDFTPVAMVVVDPMPLVVAPSLPVKTVPELIALAKQKPGELTMGSFGIGSVPHLAGELFNLLAGTKMLHVPYKGGAQALNDLIGGHVALMFNSVGAVAGPIASGKVRALAVGAPERSAGLPNIPTVRESGVPEFSATTWIGLYGPAKLPQAVVDRLSGEVATILKHPDVKKRMADMGFDTRSGTAQELADALERDRKLWGRVVSEGLVTQP
jgi:tripartite-type tricarboxylate transporter receptor subunit TctC